MGDVPLEWAWECIDAIEFWDVKKQDVKYGKEYAPACGPTCDFCACPIPQWLVDLWKKRREIERVCRAARSMLSEGSGDNDDTTSVLARLVKLVCPQD